MIKIVMVALGLLMLSGCGAQHNIYVGKTIGNTGISLSTAGGQPMIGISGTIN